MRCGGLRQILRQVGGERGDDGGGQSCEPKGQTLRVTARLFRLVTMRDMTVLGCSR